MDSSTAPLATPFKYSNRVILKTILDRNDGGLALVGEKVVIGGWVSSSKVMKKEENVVVTKEPAPDVAATQARDVSCVEILGCKIPFLQSIIRVFGGGGGAVVPPKTETAAPKLPSTVFLQLSDGSCIATLRVVLQSTIAYPREIMNTGTCILVEGELKLPAVQGKHNIELKAQEILHFGSVDQENYPLSKKRLPIHSLRDFSHFKPRTTTMASIMRIRDALSHATHTFFQNHGFLYVHMPVITTTDCEGNGEKFHVTTLLSKSSKDMEAAPVHQIHGITLDVVKDAIKEKSSIVEQLKRTGSNKEALAAAIHDLRKTNQLAAELESREKLHPEVKLHEDEIDFSKDFFSRRAYLTNSGRLHLQSYACSLGNVYSFGPRFLAERYESNKHVAEMWMIELEMAFSGLEEAMACAEDFLKFICKAVLENCTREINFFSKRFDKTNMDRLQSIISSPFEKITYSEAIDYLKQVQDKKFEKNVEWGISLAEEHESYLVDEKYEKPVIIFNYPKNVKPFYARVNKDGMTVAAFDVVVPKVGTLIRGCQNEERLSKLNTRIKELGMASEQYEWYMDLRRHGSVKNSGFAVAFELVLLVATGLVNVADVIPFPRSYGKVSH